MALQIQPLIDELAAMAKKRAADGWETYWRNCAAYCLPQENSFDTLALTGSIAKLTMAVSTATAAMRKTRSLYDQTSLWAIERLTAGLITLKTPENGTWHNLSVDDPFGYEPSHEEELWLERQRDYLFKVRANPRSGYWPAHKAAVRSMVAFGDGFVFMEERFGDVRTPWRYEFTPLGECYHGVDAQGESNKMFRVRDMSAQQIVDKWGEDAVSADTLAKANDPKRRHDMVTVVHAVCPRSDSERNKVGVRGAPFVGVYFEYEAKKVLKESGFFEFPYIRHAWSRVGAKPYSEGPMALALAEVKSLNELAKNELISAQQAVRPPLATVSENLTRVNLNAGAVNAGMMNGDGRLLVSPIMTHNRPDFAQAVLESRRSSVREMLYLNLWQILIENPQMTATEALLRSQEKGELLGPVGISLNTGIAYQVDREIGILARKGAFEEGSPLAMPESLADADLAPTFTAPLDRMRQLDDVVGAQRLMAGILEIAGQDPTIMKRVDQDEYLDIMQKGFGAPLKMLKSREDINKEEAGQPAQGQDAASQLELAKLGGEAAQAIGTGGSAIQNMLAGGGGQGPAPDVAQAVAA